MYSYAIPVLCIAAFCFSSCNAATINAQIAEDKQAHVVFDLRLDKLREYTDAHGIELNEMLHEMTGREFAPEMIADITRVYGAIQLPADEDAWMDASRMLLGPGEVMEPERFDENQKMPARESEIKDPDGEIRRPGKDGLSNVSFRSVMPRHQDNIFPVDFFIRIKFRNDEAAAVFAEMAFANANMEEVNGKSFARPGGGAPDNFTYYMADSTSFEAGTEDYLMLDDRRGLFTDRLQATWNEMPDEAIRAAIDLESVDALVSAIVDESKVGPPPTGAMMEMLNKVSTARFSMDLQAENLVSLIIAGKDETQAEELRSGLDGLLGIAKMMGGQGVQELGGMSPAMGEVAGEILGGLAATRDGNDVSILIPRPASFDEAVEMGMVEMKAAAAKMDEQNRFFQVALAVHNYYDTHRKFPFQPYGDMSENLSWRGRVSPFVATDQPVMLDTTQPFDGPANSP